MNINTIISICLSIAAGVVSGSAQRVTTNNTLSAKLAIRTATVMQRMPTSGTNHRVFMFSVTNIGAVAVSPEVKTSKLVINGKELADWSFIIMNGPRDRRWNQLPPGQSLQFGYDLADYFKTPGTYKVIWKGSTFEAPAIEFTVDTLGQWSLKKAQ